MSTTVLITGANGEIGHALIDHLAEKNDIRIIAMDLDPIDDVLRPKCSQVFIGDIRNTGLLENMSAASDFDVIFHLAALLSTRSERQPNLAHHVNVDGTLNILDMAVTQSRLQGREIRVIYPSTIAVYGLPDLNAKNQAGKVNEDQWCTPRTIYGMNKLYCEQLGLYYSKYYRQLDATQTHGHVDFRGLRFPGLISSETVPTGGTSDFNPEMLHAAALGKPYACFVRDDSRIPFMTMPDAVRALLELSEADRTKLTRQIYNVSAFNPSAGEFLETLRNDFPDADITFDPDEKRQRIVDSWPEDVDTSSAASDWGWRSGDDLASAFSDYLVPAVKKRYAVTA